MTHAVLQVADFAAPYAGSFVGMLCSLARTASERGVRTIVVLPEEARQRPWCEELIAAGQAVEFVPAGASTLELGRTLAEIARRAGATIIHTHFVRFDVAALLARWLLALRGMKLNVVWHVHSELKVRMTFARRIKFFVKYRLLGSAVQAIPVSAGVMADLRGTGFPARNINLILNGIDCDRATTAARPAREVRKDLGILADQKVLLIFAWKPLRKGLDIAMDAVASLGKSGLQVCLVAVGMDEMRAYLRQQSSGDLPPWLRAAAPLESVADYFQAADLFLCPSRSEGLSLAVLEALANGLPLVHSDIPAIQSARDNPAVVLCKPGDSASLAEAVRCVLSWTPDARARRTALGASRVREESDVGAWAGRVFAVYEKFA